MRVRTAAVMAALAAAGSAQWLIVELDRCGGNMMTDVERSYQYLVNEGLGHGR